MFLTKEEERILDGEMGEELARIMRIIVKVGEVLEAEKLVKVSRAHVSGVSYRNLGEEGVRFIEELAGTGVRFSIKTSVNPAGMDLENWREMGVKEECFLMQMRVIRALRAMGAEVTLTCTPYLYQDISYGEHLAWAESNAVLYANSVLGARTNREGGPLSLFEAIVGKAPYVGLHTEEGRTPTVVVDLASVREVVEERGLYSALGYLIGREVKVGVPLIKEGPRPLSSRENLKLFLAAIGASSSIGLALIEGISPEYREPRESLEEISIEPSQIEEVLENWSSESFDAVVIGCPHLSANELMRISMKLECGRVCRRLILFTSRAAISSAYKWVNRLRDSGVEVYADTCMVVSDLRGMGVKSCATDSAKAAYYLSGQGYRVLLAPRESLLRSVLS
ncbi:MAG: hypothetical protein DRJ43_02875 [Thermoprotei archaeon]|nr:MAG: hypothetical protein DRJ43_02875 [Thermoprotei archaeon]